MTAIPFDPAAFRLAFPAFSNQPKYPTEILQMRWDAAGMYITNRQGGCYCGGLNTVKRTYALSLMTAHLQALADMIATGNMPSIITDATIDQVKIGIEPPPAANAWQYWLQTTPYGQQLLVLLQVASVGGAYFGGSLDLAAFRRQPRIC